MTIETKSYQESLSGLQEQLTEMLPAEALDVFETDANQLQKNHPSVLKVKVGDRAPAFVLPNAVGETVQLADLLQQGQVVLTFYRGTWCPYCNLQLSLYQKSLDSIHQRGASLVAISPQTPDQSLSIKEKNELQFEVLSDAGNQVARQYTTVFRYADAPLATMGELGYDFDSFYSDDSHELPIPAVFVIDQQGYVVFAQSEGGDYRNRVEPQVILNALQS